MNKIDLEIKLDANEIAKKIDFVSYINENDLADKLNTLEKALEWKVLKDAPDFTPFETRLGSLEKSNTLKPTGKIDQRWHGGGLSKVSTDSTLTGLGTPASPLHAVFGGTVTSVTATSPITSTGGTTPVISTLVNPGKLMGRQGTGGAGVMQELSFGTGLSLSGTTVSVAFPTQPWTISGSNIYYNSGNVGIGTTAPAALLHINNSSGYAITLAQGSSGGGSIFRTTADTTAIGQLITYGSGISGAVYGVAGGNYTLLESSGAASNGLIVGTQTAKPLIFGTDYSERMRIDASGNVGIGTNAPEYKLQVAGNQDAPTSLAVTNAYAGASAQATLFIGNNNSEFLQGAITSSVFSSGAPASQAYFNTNATNGLVFYTLDATPISFAINNAPSSPSLRIAGNGNVGVGVTSPDPYTKLSVSMPVNYGVSNVVQDLTVDGSGSYFSPADLTLQNLHADNSLDFENSDYTLIGSNIDVRGASADYIASTQTIYGQKIYAEHLGDTRGGTGRFYGQYVEFNGENGGYATDDFVYGQYIKVTTVNPNSYGIYVEQPVDLGSNFVANQLVIGSPIKGVWNSTLEISRQGMGGYPRMEFSGDDASVGVVINLESGKDFYFGEPGDAGNYYFRGRNIVSEGSIQSFTLGGGGPVVADGSGVLGLGSPVVSSQWVTSGSDIYYTTGRVGVGTSSIGANLTIKAGSATAGTAPLKFLSGTLLSSPVAGVVEFLTDKFYGTITTGAVRTEFALNNNALTDGRVVFVTASGKLTDDADMTFATDTLTIPKIVYTSSSGGTTAGMVWQDSSQLAIAAYTSGVKQIIPGVLFTQTGNATVSNTVTETSIVGAGNGTLTLPANFFFSSKTLRLRIGGVYSTPALSTPSVIVKIKYGSTVIATVTTSGLLSGATNLEFDGEVLITCRTGGSSGTVIVHGDIEYSTGVAGTVAVDSLNNAGATTTINTTTSNLIDVTVAWDTNTSTRSIKSTVCTLEVLN